MKLRLSSKRNAAMTLMDVGVVVAIVIILAAVLLSVLSQNHRAPRMSNRIDCMNRLRQIGLAYHVWESDNRDTYPMGISVTNGGSMEMLARGNVVQTYLVMSNEMSTPKILVCPADSSRTAAASFSGLANSNVSYFIGVDVTNDTNPNRILSGDDNFEVGGVPVNAGLQAFGARDPITWTTARHINVGNIGMTDGSVENLGDSRLMIRLGMTGFATNRFAIP